MDCSNLIRSCLFLQILLCALYAADAACTIPDRYQNTKWTDSVKGDFEFTTWKMTNWSFKVNDTVVDEWEVADETKFETEGYVAYRSLDTFTVAGQTYYSFLCLRYDTLSPNVHRYFTLHDVSNLTDGERVLASKTEGLWRFTDICNLNYMVDRTIFNLMITPGKENEIGVKCPQSLLGNFKSSIVLPNGTIPCGQSDLTSNGCIDNSNLRLNSTNCPFPIAYSANGSLSCITSEKIGNYYYSYMYNHDDTVDNNSTFRISCMVSNEDGSKISIAPLKCQPGQIPSDFPRDHRGNKIGMLMIHTSTDSICRDEDKEDDKGMEGWVIAVIVSGSVLVFVTVVIVVVFVVKRQRCRNNKNEATEYPD